MCLCSVFSQFDYGFLGLVFSLGVFYVGFGVISRWGGCFPSVGGLVVIRVFLSELWFPMSLGGCFLVSFFVGVLLANFVGLWPFSFCVSSQFWFSMCFALVFYVCAAVIPFFVSLVGAVSHLVPGGAPFFLATFLFWVEVFSSMVRPLTLVLRLCANMVTGHVLLCLLSGTSVVVTLSWGLVGVLPFCFVMFWVVWELMVGFIQAVVFSLLVVYYFGESAIS